MAIDPNISSCEMTAVWRSDCPLISRDAQSIHMATDEGVLKARDFESRFNYPLIGRKISVRARYMLENILEFYQTGNFDTCISFASGFSLLTNQVRINIDSDTNHFHLIDSDITNIINARVKKIEQLIDDGIINSDIFTIQNQVLDLEYAAANHLKLKDIFKQVKAPIFILEGVSYFLSPQCLKWLMSEIKTFKTAAVVLDYWPEAGLEISPLFKNVVAQFAGYIPEKINSFVWSDSELADIVKGHRTLLTMPIQEAEANYSKQIKQSAQFIDPNTYFPVYLAKVLFEK